MTAACKLEAAADAFRDAQSRRGHATSASPDAPAANGRSRAVGSDIDPAIAGVTARHDHLRAPDLRCPTGAR